MFYYAIDLLGTFAFAISGVLTAMNKRLDPFGIFIIAFVTALGGGTIRDVIIGVQPVTWLVNPMYFYTIIIAVFFAFFFREKLKYLRTSLFLFDTLGIGLYTVVGVEKGLAAGLIPLMCITLGTVTACFGGVIRDILCNEIPLIFNGTIYATPCVIGGISYFILKYFNVESDIIFMVPIIVVIVIRLLAVRYNITLPNIYKTKAS
ncbi:trimeric intracellular cation channel family protein [Robertkochia solimangrovi]|uniref:trimeric intracellular cation channel family protein n=1 Tax=Robertkochia solimangrovi TaxID=2213046 RepID=UPI001181372D|nr:trimeric intracellular cation channel family protein [Robertkochia solimangrovi]TRZ45150.1 trimeric intracellular cation channel family protein [Robertkochia solimangrovi]